MGAAGRIKKGKTFRPCPFRIFTSGVKIPPVVAGGECHNELECDNIFRLQAFGALGYGELDSLAFDQGLESGIGDCTEVCKDVGT